MSWFDKLKALFSIEVNSPIVQINIVNSNNKLVKQDKIAHIDEDGKKLYISIDQLSSQQNKEMEKIIGEYIDSENKLLEIETDELLHSLYKYNKENKNKQIIEFFKPIIPEKDTEALEAALYLREVFARKGDIKKLKADISQSFGDRGNNIANLCTAGYFENFLIPLYNSSKEKFDKLYELIVEKSPFALFVHAGMSSNEIVDKIKVKLEISKKYGIKFVHIHGIGESNITKIKNCIESQKELFGFYEKKIFENEGILIIELLIN